MKSIVEKYCFVKTQYLIDDMMYEKTLNYIRQKVFITVIYTVYPNKNNSCKKKNGL